VQEVLWLSCSLGFPFISVTFDFFAYPCFFAFSFASSSILMWGADYPPPLVCKGCLIRLPVSQYTLFSVFGNLIAFIAYLFSILVLNAPYLVLSRPWKKSMAWTFSFTFTGLA
jgi:hypothetical protein